VESLNAHFIADFNSFYDAVTKAETQLKDFDSDANKVEASLNRVADSLSGRKLIQEATLMQKAVEDIGGVSRLTADELARVGAQADTAIEKMKKMGVEIPPGLQKIADEAHNTESSVLHLADIAKEAFENPAAAVKSLIELLGPEGLVGAAGVAAATIGGLLVRQLFELTEQAAAAGGQINDLSEKMAISTEETSKLKFAADVAGGSIDEVANAMFNMERRLGEGGKEAEKIAQGLGRIGLSVEDIMALNPGERFLEIADAFRKNTDETNRSTTAFELWNRQGRDLVPLVMKPLKELADQSEQLGVIWSEQDAKAAEDLEIASRKLHKEWESMWVNIGKEFIPKLHSLFDAWTLLLNPTGTGPNPFTSKDLWNQVIPEIKNAGDKTKDLAKAAGDPLLEGWSVKLKKAADGNKAVADSAAIVVGTTADELEKLITLSKVTDTWGLGIGQLVQRVPDLNTHLITQRDAIAAIVDELLPLTTFMPRLTQYDEDLAEDIDMGLVPAYAKLTAGVKAYNTEAIKSATATSESSSGLKDIQTVLGGLSKDFVQLSQITGDSFSKFSQNVGLGIKAADQLTKTITVLDSLTKLNAQSVTEGAAAWLAFAGVLWQVGQALDNASQQEQDLTRMNEVIEQLRTDFGTRLPESLEATINAQRKAFFMSNQFREALQGVRDDLLVPGDPGRRFEEFTRQAAEAFNLAKEIEALGGAGALSGEQLAAVSHQVDILVDLMGKAGPIGHQAAAALADAFGEFGDTLTISKEQAQKLFDEIQQGGQVGADAAKAVNALFKAQEPDFKALTETAKKYGLTLAELGPKFQQADITGKAKALLGDIEPLLKQGADYGAIINHTAGAFNEIVQEALKTGQQVPENMRPYLEALAASGQLLDENGEKMTNLDRINFGQSLQDATNDLTKALEHLSDILTGNLPDDAEQSAKDIQGALSSIHPPAIHVPIVYDLPPVPGPGQPTASSTTAPASARVLAFTPRSGPAVLTAAQTQAIVASAPAAGGGGTVVLQVDGRTMAEIVVPNIPGVVERYALGR